MASLHERIFEWFTNHYGRETFRLSMGEQIVEAAGYNVLLGFMAQGIVHAGYTEARYLVQLIEMHRKLKSVVDDLSKIPGHNTRAEFHYPLILGSLIELALMAINELKKEDRKDDDDG